MVNINVGLLLSAMSLLLAIAALFRVIIIHPMDKKFAQLEKNIIDQVQHIYLAENSKRMDQMDRAFNERLREIQHDTAMHNRMTMIWAEALYVELLRNDLEPPNPRNFNWDTTASPTPESKSTPTLTSTK